MKKILLLFSLAGMLSLASCDSNDDDGPIVDNDTISEVFEVDNVDFTTTNNFSNIYTLNPNIYTSDVVLVYELVGANGTQDVWALLPQVYYTSDGGSYQYNFDFSANSFRIFMDGNTDLTTLPASATQDKIFRVVIVPGSFSSTVNVNDYNAVMSALESNGQEVRVIER